MNKIILNIIAIVSLLVTVGCQEEGKAVNEKMKLTNDTYTNQIFNWSLTIPKDWRTLTKLEEGLFERIGDKAAEKEFKQKSTDTWTTILSLQNGIKINQLTAHYGKYNKELHGDSYEDSKATRFYGTLKIVKKREDVEAKSKRENITIDDVVFDTFTFSVRQNGQHKYDQMLLEKKYGNDDMLLINIFASETEKMDEFLNTLKASKFGRKN